MDPPNSRKRRGIADIIESVTKKLAYGGFRCAAVENCSYTQATYSVGNLKRHIQKLHPREYEILNLGTSQSNAHPAERQDPKISVRMSRERLFGGVIKCVSLHGLPFSFIHLEGIKDLVDPYCEALKVSINDKNVHQYLGKVASAIDTIIKDDVCGKMISLKIDAASKMYRSVLGINAQLITEEGEYKKLTLGKH